MKLKEYLTEAKPKKGQFVILDLGQKEKIQTISKGVAYVGSSRLPIFVRNLEPSGEPNTWKHKDD